MKKLLILISMVFLVSTFTYAQEPSATESTQTPMTEARVVAIATAYAIGQQNVSPEWFGGRVRANLEGDQWHIFFMGKPNEDGAYLTGDHFMIFLSSSGEVTSYFRGL